MVISEFLASLGLQDNFSGPLDQTLVKGEESLSNFKNATAKQLALAGVSFVGFISAAAVGLVKFSKHLLQTDEDIANLAKDLEISKDEAFSTKMALDSMGRSLDEIEADPKLVDEFKELKALASEIKPPDMSESLGQVRDLGKEFNKSKQIIGVGIQWIGHYFLKYIEKPLNDLKEMLSKLNKNSMKALPKFAEAIGKAMSWVVRLITRIAQTAGKVWKTVGKILDKIPDKVKLIGGALSALGLIIKSGPMGIFIALISAALLLLDDFFTFLEGGESLLAPFWEMLTGMFDGFTESGENAISWFSKEFFPELIKIITEQIPILLDSLTEIIKEIIESLGGFAPLLIEAGADILSAIIQGIMAVIPSLASTILEIATTIIRVILENIPNLLNAGTQILNSLIDGIIKMLPQLMDIGIAILEQIIQALMDNLPEIIDAGVGLVMSLINGVVNALPDIVKMVTKLLDLLIKTIVNNLPKLVEMGINLVLSLIDGIFNALPDIAVAIFDLINSIRSTIFENLPQIIEAGVKILVSLIEGIFKLQEKIPEAATKIFSKLMESFKKMPEKMKETGKKFVENLFLGIQSMGTWLKDKVSGWLGGVVDGFKGMFGGDGGDKTPKSNSDGHADGGIFDKEHIANFAEGNKPEAIIPLTKPKRAMEVLGGVGKYLGINQNGQSDYAPYLEQLVSSLGNISSSLESMNNIMNSMQNISSSQNTSSIINNNQQYTQNTDISVYDNSGSPDQTASTIYNNQTNIMRDLKGMGV